MFAAGERPAEIREHTRRTCSDIEMAQYQECFPQVAVTDTARRTEDMSSSPLANNNFPTHNERSRAQMVNQGKVIRSNGRHHHVQACGADLLALLFCQQRVSSIAGLGSM